MAAERLVAIALLLGAAAACGEESNPATPATTRPTVSTVLPPTSAAAARLTRAQSCQRFLTIVSDFKLNDDQSAVALSVLTQQTSDPTLAAAIQRVADGFARHASSISSTEVQALCR